jgi:hypothetical protein
MCDELWICQAGILYLIYYSCSCRSTEFSVAVHMNRFPAGASSPASSAATVASVVFDPYAQRGQLGSRQLDVLAGWLRFLALHFPVVGYVDADSEKGNIKNTSGR